MARTDSTALDGKVVLLTGATGGIGVATSRQFAEQGAQLVLVARRRAEGDALAQELGTERTVFVPADLALDDAPGEIVEKAVETFGRVDVLINNAGEDLAVPFFETSLEQAKRVFDVNFFAAWRLMQEGARVMTDQGGGAIINITSRVASVGVAGLSVYSASKGAILSLTRAAAIELAPIGVRVNAVAPGLTDTPLIRAWIDEQPDPTSFEKDLVASVPQKRLANPEEVAATILFLSSDDSRHITGASIAIDGGYTAA